METTRHPENSLIIASSERDANLFHAIQFLAPDPLILIQTRGRKILLVNDLELDRARRDAQVDEVIATQKISDKLKKRGHHKITTSDIAHFILTERGIREFSVPANFPTVYADELRRRGHLVHPKREPFFEHRAIKSKIEIEAIEHSQRAIEKAVRIAESVLQKSVIHGSFLYYRKKRLTSEFLKRAIQIALMEENCVVKYTIVASGPQTSNPHDAGHGPVPANQPIIMDVFPQSLDSQYFADMTRTFVRGKASPEIKKMYRAVRQAQELVFEKIHAGANGKLIHEAVVHFFDKSGFKTGEFGGHMQGFFHGTGHGVGLEVHEAPRISRIDSILKEGAVVTVEPGLYYHKIGGVRIEDMVVVTKHGCRNLTKYRKVLEI